MTRQHFNAIAATCRDYLPAGIEADAFVVALAGTLAGFNPRFDRARFIEAATPEPFPVCPVCGDTEDYCSSS